MKLKFKIKKQEITTLDSDFNPITNSIGFVVKCKRKGFTGFFKDYWRILYDNNYHHGFIKYFTDQEPAYKLLYAENFLVYDTKKDALDSIKAFENWISKTKNYDNIFSKYEQKYLIFYSIFIYVPYLYIIKSIQRYWLTLLLILIIILLIIY